MSRLTYVDVPHDLLKQVGWDNAQAAREGWRLVIDACAISAKLVLMASGEHVSEDSTYILRVRDAALAGSEYHIRAMMLVRTYSPGELEYATAMELERKLARG